MAPLVPRPRSIGLLIVTALVVIAAVLVLRSRRSGGDDDRERAASPTDALREILLIDDPTERSAALARHLERAKREAAESSRSQVRALLER